MSLKNVSVGWVDPEAHPETGDEYHYLLIIYVTVTAITVIG